MAYFSNGTEGCQYEEEYCNNCVRELMEYKGNEYTCPIWDAHMLWNYDECNNKESILHKMIPINESGFAGKCKFFIQK